MSSKGMSLRPWVCQVPVIPGRTLRPHLEMPAHERGLIERKRARSHQAHVTAQHVPELRQFVYRPPAELGSEPRDPRIIPELQQTVAVCVDALLPHVRAHRVGSVDHRPELDRIELAAVPANAGLPEEHGPRRIQLDPNRDDGEQRAEKYEARRS